MNINDYYIYKQAGFFSDFRDKWNTYHNNRNEDYAKLSDSWSNWYRNKGTYGDVLGANWNLVKNRVRDRFKGYKWLAGQAWNGAKNVAKAVYPYTAIGLGQRAYNYFTGK